jgi:acetate---CoA ligase (ADP-forming)
MTGQLEKLLKPSAIAIIGASRDPAKRGARAIAALLAYGYKGKIVPINPNETEINSLPCYPDVASVPFDIDLALVCTPSRMAPDVIRRCAEKRIPGAVVLAGGFSEASAEGAVLEAELVQAARAGNVRFVGPNTPGIFDAHTGVNLLGLPGVSKGSLGVLSQSGNVLLSLVAQSLHQGFSGFTTFVGVGNQSDVQFHEYLQFYGDDARTKTLIIYLEGLKDGRAFLNEARKLSRRKPVVVYKSGRTKQGESAAKSHSGSLAGDYAVALGVLRQAGLIVVERSDEIFPVADMLSRDAGKSAKRVAILSEGGGPIAQAVDSLVELGLDLPQLEGATEARLKKITPAASQLSNPVDAGGGTDPHPRYFPPCSREILADPNIDALLIVGYFGAYQIRWGQSMAEAENAAARELAALKEEFGKPIVVQCHFAESRSEGTRILREAGIPVVRSIELAARCIAAVEEYAAVLRRPVETADPASASTQCVDSERLIANAKAAGHQALLEPDALRLLALHGIRVPEIGILKQPADAENLPNALRAAPVALKVVSKDILHKTDVGGVMLNRRGAADIASGMKALLERVKGRMPRADVQGVLVVPMARPGVEIILGVTNDPHYGRVMLFGIGGTMVEVYRDVAFCALPLTADDAHRVLASIRGKAILDGVRGAPPVDREQLVQLMLGLSRLAQQHREITEIDLNPVIVDAEGYTVVDARMVLGT